MPDSVGSVVLVLARTVATLPVKFDQPVQNDTLPILRAQPERNTGGFFGRRPEVKVPIFNP